MKLWDELKETPIMNTETVTKTKTEYKPFNGFVVRNPRKGGIYLCRNNYISRYKCPGCGRHDKAGWPICFLFEGNPSCPVCDDCALEEGFTMSPELWRHLLNDIVQVTMYGVVVKPELDESPAN
jgi:hypothetical protein